MDCRISSLKKDLHSILNASEENIEVIQAKAAYVEERIKQLEQIRHTKIRDNLATKYRLESEHSVNPGSMQTKRDAHEIPYKLYDYPLLRQTHRGILNAPLRWQILRAHTTKTFRLIIWPTMSWNRNMKRY